MQTKESDQNPESNTISAVVNALAAEAEHVNNQRLVQHQCILGHTYTLTYIFYFQVMIARV
jgi:hypothetical protein